MPQTADVVVIGAGVVGCSVAYYLTREGVDVTLLERDAIGSGASAHATGSLSLLGAEFSPGASFEMARASYAEFPQLVAELESATSMDLLYQRRPSLRLALDDEEAGTIRELMTWQQPHVSMRWIDAQEVRSIEPRLSHSIIGAVYEDESAQLDSYRFNLALARGAELKGADHPVPRGNRPGQRWPQDYRRIHFVGGYSLRISGGGRRHLEPRVHALAGISRTRAAHEGRTAAVELPRRAAAGAPQLPQTRAHDQPNRRPHQRRQHRRPGLRPEGALLGRGV